MKFKFIIVCIVLSIIFLQGIVALQNSIPDQERKFACASSVGATEVPTNTGELRWRTYAHLPIGLSGKTLQAHNLSYTVHKALENMSLPLPVISIIAEYTFDEKDKEFNYYDGTHDRINGLAHMTYKGNPMIIAGSAQGKIYICNPHNRKIYAQFQLTSCIHALAFSQKHNMLIIAAFDCSELYYIKYNALKMSLINSITLTTPHASQIALAPDEMHVALANGLERIDIWSLPDGILFDTYSQRTPSMSWNYDGTRLLSVQAAMSSVIYSRYNIKTKAVSSKCHEHVFSHIIGCSPIKNQAVAVWKWDELMIFDILTGEIIRSLEPPEGINAGHHRIVWSPDGHYIASINLSSRPQVGKGTVSEGQVNMWHAPTGKLIGSFFGVDPYGPLCFVSNKILAASSYEPGGVVIFTGADA